MGSSTGERVAALKASISRWSSTRLLTILVVVAAGAAGAGTLRAAPAAARGSAGIPARLGRRPSARARLGAVLARLDRPQRSVVAAAVPSSPDHRPSVTGPATAVEPAAPDSSLIGSPLLVPGVEALDGGQEVSGVEATMRSAPLAVAAREASRTRFAALGAESSLRVARRDFPGLFDAPPQGVSLPSGAHVTRYLSSRAASIDLAGGEHAVLEGIHPISVDTAGGRRVPLDLSLESGEGWRPRRPAVAVRIPRQLREGVHVGALGVSVTPIDARSGRPLAGTGALEGSGVFFSDTQRDADTLFQPTPEGVEADTFLRSAASPQRLGFRVALPAGGRLVQRQPRGAVALLVDGQRVGSVLAPVARDAAGTEVPVSMRVAGDRLVLTVDHATGSYLYPIVVDPTFVEEQLPNYGPRSTNWEFKTTNPGAFKKQELEGPPPVLETYASGATYHAKEIAYWGYQTKGNSDIYEVTVATWAANAGAHIESLLELQHGEKVGESEVGITESSELLSAEANGTSEYADKITTLCPTTANHCLPLTGHEHNAVHFQQSAAKECVNCGFSDSIREGLVYLSQPGHSTASLNRTSPEIEFEVEHEGKKEKQRRKNALYGVGQWLSPFQGALELISADAGIGVAQTKLEYESGPGEWQPVIEHNYLEKEDKCKGVQCYAEHKEAWTLNSHLPNGEDKIRYAARTAMAGTESTSSEGVATVKVDASKPHDILISGLPFSGEIREASYQITAKAIDGEGSTVPSSGIKSLSLFVDGHEVGSPGGACQVPKGECIGTATWTVNGAELGSGTATIVVVAVDNAGNEERKGELITVSHSKPVALGPGSLNLESGNFSLGADDVSMGSGLTVSRTYSSRNLKAGELGPLGPLWAMSVANDESLQELGEGSIELTSANGSQSLFLYLGAGHGYEPPVGDSNLSLTVEENEKHEKVAYYLSDALNKSRVKFTKIGSGVAWVPTVQEGAVASDTDTFKWRTVEEGGHQVTEPLEARAPVPAGVECSYKTHPREMHAGCRALEFKYDEEETTAGETQEHWGAYKGRLEKVLLVAYNPAAREMQEIPVAEYAYDKKGRLRGEWDPRISPRLEVTYGYDPEGHLTALNPPGEEPWLMTYGTADNDRGAGRLVKIVRSPATAEIAVREAPANTAPPTISGSPLIGVRDAVSKGSWATEPTIYAYQWQRCSTTGTECAPIPGATNANYTPVAADGGHTLRASVTATNSGGSGSATSSATAIVGARAEEISVPEATYVGTGKENSLWITRGKNPIVEITASGETKEWPLPEGVEAGLITLGGDGNMWFADHAGSPHIAALHPNGEVTVLPICQTKYSGSLTWGPEGRVWTTCGSTFLEENTQLTVDAVNPSTGAQSYYGLPENGEGGSVATAAGSVWVAVSQFGLNKKTYGGIYRFNGNGQIIYEHKSGPVGFLTSGNNFPTAGPNGSVWFGGNEGGLFEITAEGTFKDLERIEPSGGMTEGVDGNMWYTAKPLIGEKWQIDRVTPTNEATVYELAEKVEATSIARGPLGDVWYVIKGGKVGRMPPTGPATPEEAAAIGPEPGTAVEYNVPLIGNGAPAQIGENASGIEESSAWGQRDYPAEGTSIVSEDSPQGWPAASYSRATTYYVDAQGRLVNVAKPSHSAYGAITTTEYNEFNDVTRTLTPDNRVTALEAGAKSSEVAQLLDTKYVYNGENAQEWEVTEPGTQLLSVLGPQHKVKYKAGKEVKESLARNHQEYFYDQGRPPGQPFESEAYDLVTEEADLAQLPNHEEVEVHTVKKSYAGQENLGWKLRQPTGVTQDPNGLDVTTSTIYDPVTGQATETRGASGLAGNSARDSRTVYYSTAANSEFNNCGEHPEWQGLICEKLPAKQPEGSVAPKLPVTTTTYNVFNQPETITETFGTATRVKTYHRDAAGRIERSEVTATGTTDKPVPAVTDHYSATTGRLISAEAAGEGGEKKVAREYDTLGRMIRYEDADGGVTTYRYYGSEHDGALAELKDNAGGGGGSWQTYSYDPVTQQVAELTDAAAGKFTATYDAEGAMTSEVYPDGLCATRTHNSVGEDTKIEYVKSASCEAGAPVWFSETKTPTVHGETVSRISTLAKENYSYDALGRLLETEEVPTGAGCTIRLYAYDAESNRKSQTVRKPKTNGECNTKGGTVTEHTYDEGNRLVDLETEYDAFGNVTKLSKADAEKEAIATTYYVDNAVATQLQGTKLTDTYGLDPEGRVDTTLATESKGKIVKKNFVSHYDGADGTVSWTSEGAKWTRDIPGIDGSLSAVEVNGETTTLEIHDLNGNVVGTASLSAESKELLSTYNSTEFGTPGPSGAPPQYAWLGALGVGSERASGLITEGSTSYVPQTGQPLQSEQVEPPGLPNGSGGGAAVVFEEEAWNMQGAERVGAEAPGREAGREREAAEAACRANLLACPVEVLDPHWIWHLTIHQAEQLEGTLAAPEILSWAKLGDDINRLLGIDLFAKAEAWIEQKIAGYSADEVKDWAFHLAYSLGECTGDYIFGARHPNSNAHCWVWIKTSEYKVGFETPLGWIGAVFEVPTFKSDPIVKYCPWGSGYCYPT
jgi:streptogramin lyase